MDVASAVDGLLLVLGTLCYLLTRLLYYVLYLLHILVSPLLYLGHGVLTIALLPLQLLAKFEVFIHNHLYLLAWIILEAHLITGHSLLHYWSGAHGGHRRPGPTLRR